MTQTKIDSIIFPVSSKYVSDWGVWHGARELIQNAMDAERDPRVTSTYSINNGTLTLTTKGVVLDKKTLLLGFSQKANGSIGKFGEGYKLALLVLTRAGKTVEIHTGSEVWRPFLKEDSKFGDEKVLHVDFFSAKPSTDTKITVSGLTEDEMRKIYTNALVFSSPEIKETHVLRKPEHRGKLYSGGLYVMDLYTEENSGEWLFGYNFNIELDRDRNQVDEYRLMYDMSAAFSEFNEVEYNTLLRLPTQEARFITPAYMSRTMFEKWTKRFDKPVHSVRGDRVNSLRASAIFRTSDVLFLESPNVFVEKLFESFVGKPESFIDKHSATNDHIAEIAVSSLSERERTLFDELQRILNVVAQYPRPKLKICDQSTRYLGLCSESGEIWINASLLAEGKRGMAIATLAHEVAHWKTIALTGSMASDGSVAHCQEVDTVNGQIYNYLEWASK